MDEDEVIKKITKLLEQGCTMLATHHDCGAPLFRCKGEIVCPVCTFEPSQTLSESVSSSSGPAVHPDEHTEKKEAVVCDEHKLVSTNNQQQAEAHLRESLLRKLKELTESMETEQDLDKLGKQLECLEGLMKVLRYIEL